MKSLLTKIIVKSGSKREIMGRFNLPINNVPYEDVTNSKYDKKTQSENVFFYISYGKLIGVNKDKLFFKTAFDHIALNRKHFTLNSNAILMVDSKYCNLKEIKKNRIGFGYDNSHYPNKLSLNKNRNKNRIENRRQKVEREIRNNLYKKLHAYKINKSFNKSDDEIMKKSVELLTISAHAIVNYNQDFVKQIKGKCLGNGVDNYIVTLTQYLTSFVANKKSYDICKDSFYEINYKESKHYLLDFISLNK